MSDTLNIQRFVKRPVEIQAVTLTPGNQADVIDWLDEGGVGSYPAFDASGLVIPTLEGDMEARWGDHIIKGVNGEFYPCKPDIFEKTY